MIIRRIAKKLKGKYLRFLSAIFNYLPFNNKFLIDRENTLSINGNFLKKTKIIIHGKNNRILFHSDGRNFLNKCIVRVYGDNNNILINGERNSFNNVEIWVEDNNNNMMFGNRNVISGKTHIALTEGTNVIFKDDCLLSSEIIFRTGDSHSILSDETGKRINNALSITVGNRVWIGNRVIVLKGVEIPSDCVVATGSIVVKKIDETHVILAGNPAKIVKHNISWIKERI
jgi:acetyltransferase-like isoleucine patch superfamily enzyme